jgi:hypothetical protein
MYFCKKNGRHEMAKDLFHEAVRTALENDGWTITHDPYIVLSDVLEVRYEIDLGAEKTIAAYRGTEKIAVEVKSFVRSSAIYEFHGALGQYLNYLIGLEEVEPDRILYLAVPYTVYREYLTLEALQRSIERYGVKIIVYNAIEKKIVKWIK